MKILCIKFKLVMNFLPPNADRYNSLPMAKEDFTVLHPSSIGFQTDQKKYNKMTEVGIRRNRNNAYPLPSTAILANILFCP